jgi:ribonuclease T2
MRVFYLIILITPVLCWDYLLFVQIWPPSWLIRANTTYNYTNNYFTIHGYWPQYFNGSWPQFCNNTQPFNTTNISGITTNLTTYWTDFINPYDFWKHEYYKHLTCLENIYHDPYMFYITGLHNRQQFNLYNFLQSNNIYPSNTKQYKTANILKTITTNLHYTPTIICENKMLSQIYICMNKKLKLINCPPTNDACKNDLITFNIYNNTLT